MTRTIHPGDDGKTGILGDGRVKKYDHRIEALGAVDEADACFGVIRAMSDLERIKRVCLSVMNRLHVAMTEVSTDDANRSKFPKISESDIIWLEDQIDELRSEITPMKGFILAGDTQLSALINKARTAVRRAERRVIQIIDEHVIPPGSLRGFFNRLGTLCYYLQEWEIQASSKNITQIRN